MMEIVEIVPDLIMLVAGIFESKENDSTSINKANKLEVEDGS